MNVFSIVRTRWPVVVPPPLYLSCDIYSFTSYNAPSTGTPFALKLTPSPILWLLRESRAPEFARNSSFTNVFLTVFACSNSVVNSFDVNVVFSNCFEIFSRIFSATVTFCLSVVTSDFFTYFCRSSFTVSRECLISVSVLGVTTVSSLTFLGATVSPVLGFTFGKDFAIEMALFTFTTWPSTSIWVAASFWNTSFALDNTPSYSNILVLETFLRFTWFNNSDNVSIACDKVLLSALGAATSVGCSFDALSASFDAFSVFSATTFVSTFLSSIATTGCAFSFGLPVPILSSGFVVWSAESVPDSTSAWTIEAFARKNVPINAEVTPNENLRIENRCTWFHMFSFFLLIVFSLLYRFYAIVIVLKIL